MPACSGRRKIPWMLARLVCPAVLAWTACNGVTQNASRWFVIGGSNSDIPGALQVQHKVLPTRPEATIVASEDCEGLRPGLFLTVVAAADRASALASLQRLRTQVPDAYVRECRPKPDGRIMLGIPLLDVSIDRVPGDVVNWTDRDRISTVQPLSAGGYLWVRRSYEAIPDDVREGRRQAVLFFASDPGQAWLVEADCVDPQFARLGDWLALSCAKETAAEQLLHTTRVFSIAGRAAVRSVRRCRKPEIVSATELSCQAETVDSSGELHLTQNRVEFR